MNGHYRLIRQTVADLAVDIRLCQRALNAAIWHDKWPKSEEQTYLRVCRDKVSAIYKTRHFCKVDQFGWPIDPR